MNFLYVKAGLSEAMSVNLSLRLPDAQMLNHFNSVSIYVCILNFIMIFFVLKSDKN